MDSATGSCSLLNIQKLVSLPYQMFRPTFNTYWKSPLKTGYENLLLLRWWLRRVLHSCHLNSLLVMPTKLTNPKQCSIGVARPVLHRRSACAFLLPPPPRTEQCGGRRQEQLRLFRGKSSRGEAWGGVGCPTAYIRLFFPATTTYHQKPLQKPPVHQHQEPLLPPLTPATSRAQASAHAWVIYTSCYSVMDWPQFDVTWNCTMDPQCRFTG